jgi:multidrug efflux pump subunit AcrA (membrane-fusion protein)
MVRRGRFGASILYLPGIVVVAGAGLGAYRMWYDKDANLSATRQALAECVARGSVVQFAQVTQGPKERPIQLLGDARSFQAATLYSKVSGNVTATNVDRGDRVKYGDLLATVSSVETHQQYEAALHDPDNKTCKWARAQDLVAHGWTSRQAADQAQTDFTMATANVAQIATLE